MRDLFFERDEAAFEAILGVLLRTTVQSHYARELCHFTAIEQNNLQFPTESLVLLACCRDLLIPSITGERTSHVTSLFARRIIYTLR